MKLGMFSKEHYRKAWLLTLKRHQSVCAPQKLNTIKFRVNSDSNTLPFV